MMLLQSIGGPCLESIGRPTLAVPHPTENLPLDWGCIPKQTDSLTTRHGATWFGNDEALTLSGAPFQGTWARPTAEEASPDYNSDTEGDRLSWWPTDPHGSKSRKDGGGDTYDWCRALAQPPSLTTPSTVDSVFNQPWDIARGKPTFALLGSTCVQRLDGSRDYAIHTKYRISLRSSLMQELRYPLPRVFRISQEDTTEGVVPLDTRGIEVPNTSSHP
ncbi:hypothetical protein TanjilG_06497 [Lupinus angustifolius]|uniref:Uncharacterized protein n=1 Tax=Lupinus angustifolius TaxID=3871 RepID=A0A4P1REU7_LUPAN|nr:hypothetical protein TanjilG_06497 [Lupinus angustifolius]